MERHTIDRRTVLTSAAAGSVGLLSGCIGGELGNGGSQTEFLSEDITFIVTFSAGGGFDTYARGLVDNLPSHLPEEVNFVVENQTPNFTGLMNIWRADPDGHTIGTTAALGMVARQIVEDVPYDMREFTWLSRMALTEYMIAAGSDTGYSSVDDLRNAGEVKWATPGAGTTAWLASIISATDLEIDFKVTNFEGTQEAAAAVLRGDVDVMLGPTTSPSLTEPLSAGDLEPIVSFTEEPPESAPNSDTAVDIGQEGLMDLNLNRPVFGPPDIPDDRASTLSESIVDTLNSDEMQQWAEENERPINAAGREEMSSTISGAFDTLSQYEDLLNEHLDQ